MIKPITDNKYSTSSKVNSKESPIHGLGAIFLVAVEVLACALLL